MESEEESGRDTQGGRSASGSGSSYTSHTSKYNSARGSDDSIARGPQGRSGVTDSGGFYPVSLSNSRTARGSTVQQVTYMLPII